MADLNRPLNSIAPKLASTIQPTDTIIVMSTAGDTNQAPLFDAVSKANADNGCLCVRTAKVELTPAQVIAGGPYPFGIAPAAGEFISPLRAFIKIDHAGADFDEMNLGLRFAGSTSSFASFDALSASVDTFSGFNFSSEIGSGEFIVQNADVEIDIAGPPTVGGSTVTIYLVYTVIDL